jgi:hypothetical protein
LSKSIIAASIHRDIRKVHVSPRLSPILSAERAATSIGFARIYGRDTIFDGDEGAADDAARTLRELGLLRTQQDSGALQAVVMVRDHKISVHAYVV